MNGNTLHGKMWMLKSIIRFGVFLLVAGLVSSCMVSDETSETIQAAGSPAISTDQPSYSPTQLITVSWTNSPGNVFDFVALMPAGAPAQSPPVAWSYTMAQVDGTRTFGAIPVGNYEARLYLAGGSYTILAISSFAVTGATVTTDKTAYLTTDLGVVVGWSGMPATAGYYVAISVAGAPANSTLQTFSTGGAAGGSHTFSTPTAGNYEARAYSNTNTILASSAFSVVAMSTITTDKALYSPNASITVTWTGATGNTYDYIAIMPAGSPAQSPPVAWFYVNGVVNGSKTIPGISSGSYEARLYLHNTYTILASSVFNVASTCMVGTRPTVQSVTSGDLVIGPTQQFANAAMTPPLTSSILFTTVRESEPSPAFGGVMCYLHGDLTTPMLPAGMVCTRGAMGTDTGSGTINVHWTVVTFSSGVSVQRGIANTGVTNPTTVTLTPAVTTGESFVILNGILTGGTGWGNNEFVRSQLVNGTTLDVRTNVAGSQVAWQVVDMVGASVQRGTTSFASSDVQKLVTISNAPSGSVPFVSYTSDNASGIAAATLMMRSRLSNSTTLELTRGLGGSALDVAWEIASLPFGTFSGITNLAAGQSSRTETVTGISGTQSVGVCSTESLLGLSTGSTTYQGSALDLVGEAATTLTAGAGTLDVVRSSSQANATIPWTVIDFSKDCAGN